MNWFKKLKRKNRALPKASPGTIVDFELIGDRITFVIMEVRFNDDGVYLYLRDSDSYKAEYTID